MSLCALCSASRHLRLSCSTLRDFIEVKESKEMSYAGTVRDDPI